MEVLFRVKNINGNVIIEDTVIFALEKSFLIDKLRTER